MLALRELGLLLAEIRWHRLCLGKGERPTMRESSSEMKRFVISLFFLLAFAVVEAAYAEGNCPPGFYPIGGQGVQGCAPIPGAAGAGSSSVTPEPPRPTGEWIKTWGGLAGAIGGAEGGAAVGAKSKDEASRLAIQNCEKSSGRTCKVEFVYFNQCAVAVVSSLASTGTQYAGGPTIEAATTTALNACRSKGAKQCRTIYSACSEPIFRAF
ncbi:MAG: DUF4189 domain-containing protein [Stenotrophomonas maltophilia]